MRKLRGKAKQDFLDRMAKGRRKAARKNPPKKKVAKKKIIKRKKNTHLKRKANPSNKRLQNAVDLFRRFRGEDPEFITRLKINVPKECMAIGQLDGVLYTTVRDGNKESYIHKFKGRSRPTLVSSWDGKQLFIVEGSYNFTEEGIVDAKPKTHGSADLM